MFMCKCMRSITKCRTTNIYSFVFSFHLSFFERLFPSRRVDSMIFPRIKCYRRRIRKQLESHEYCKRMNEALQCLST